MKTIKLSFPYKEKKNQIEAIFIGAGAAGSAGGPPFGPLPATANVGTHGPPTTSIFSNQTPSSGERLRREPAVVLGEINIEL